MHNFSLSKKDQKRIWDEARNAAGPRYTKDINVELPIKELFEGIARTDRVFEEIEKLKKELADSFRLVGYKKASSYKDKIIRKNLFRIKDLGEKFVKTINLLGKDRSKNLDLRTVTKEVGKISKYFLPID